MTTTGTRSPGPSPNSRRAAASPARGPSSAGSQTPRRASGVSRTISSPLDDNDLPSSTSVFACSGVSGLGPSLHAFFFFPPSALPRFYFFAHRAFCRRCLAVLFRDAQTAELTFAKLRPPLLLCFAVKRKSSGCGQMFILVASSPSEAGQRRRRSFCAHVHTLILLIGGKPAQGNGYLIDWVLPQRSGIFTYMISACRESSYV